MNTSTHAQTTEHLTGAAHEAIDRVAKVAAGAEQRIRSTTEQAAEKAERTQQQAEAAFDRTVAELKRRIETSPLASAGIAFAAGAVLAALIRR